MTLALTGSEIVHMDKNTFMWVQLTTFAIDPNQDDRSLLASLIATPGYAHDYASPFGGSEAIREPAVHGRWWLTSISPNAFEPISASDAETLVQSWADDQEWTDPGYRQPPEVRDRLQRVFTLLRSGDLYRLNNPSAEDEHEYGFVTGGMGFYEFVVIDKGNRSLTVVVASDD